MKPKSEHLLESILSAFRMYFINSPTATLELSQFVRGYMTCLIGNDVFNYRIKDLSFEESAEILKQRVELWRNNKTKEDNSTNPASNIAVRPNNSTDPASDIAVRPNFNKGEKVEWYHQCVHCAFGCGNAPNTKEWGLVFGSSFLVNNLWWTPVSVHGEYHPIVIESRLLYKMEN